MDKMIKDGKVAILYSPGFGAGWYTWNSDHPEMVFDKEIVSAILQNYKDKALSLAAVKYPEAYLGGLDGLEVMWLDEGSQFEIEEYDGSESVHLIGDKKYLLA